MAIGLIENKVTEWLELVDKRLEIPRNYLQINYQSDADLLFIKFTDSETTYSDDDMDIGVIYNYDADDKLVSIEVLDLYGVYV
ncbi:MAG: DUF2283 domain-containing protein [Acidobacteriota bacterium]|nr:DUF2283 domain-containing protein [Acidobacteriota bacterium]